MGRVGSHFFALWWVGLCRVHELVGRVGLGQLKVTHVQLCVTCNLMSWDWSKVRIAGKRSCLGKCFIADL